VKSFKPKRQAATKRDNISHSKKDRRSYQGKIIQEKEKAERLEVTGLKSTPGKCDLSPKDADPPIKRTTPPWAHCDGEVPGARRTKKIDFSRKRACGFQSQLTEGRHGGNESIFQKVKNSDDQLEKRAES